MNRAEMLNALQTMDSRTRQNLGIVLAVVVVVLLALSTINGKIRGMEKKKLAREADVAEMLKLKLRYQEVKAGSQQLTNRLMATKPDDSPAKVIEEIGIKGRNSQIKPVKGDDLPGYIEDAADVKIEGLTANEATNLMYRLEKGTRPVTIKKALIRPRFDDPSKLDLNLTIALIKQAAAGNR